MLLATIGFLALQTYDLHGIIAELKGKMDGTSERLDRIASALPDISVRIAQEELRKPITLAVVTTKPEEVAPGQWQAQVHLVDPQKKEVTTITKVASGPNDRTVATMVQGVAADSSTETVNMVTVQLILREAGAINFAAPLGFDPQATIFITDKRGKDIFAHSFAEIIKGGSAVTRGTEFKAGTVGVVGPELEILREELQGSQG